ncbi:hypothetical protein JW711_01485 [Candidatus Woesearchaeota archaeon]|nr:hypothetical protein [Candidatus Woesearchaeota archaeon]
MTWVVNYSLILEDLVDGLYQDRSPFGNAWGYPPGFPREAIIPLTGKELKPAWFIIHLASVMLGA